MTRLNVSSDSEKAPHPGGLLMSLWHNTGNRGCGTAVNWTSYLEKAIKDLKVTSQLLRTKDHDDGINQGSRQETLDLRIHMCSDWKIRTKGASGIFSLKAKNHIKHKKYILIFVNRNAATYIQTCMQYLVSSKLIRPPRSLLICVAQLAERQYSQPCVTPSQSTWHTQGTCRRQRTLCAATPDHWVAACFSRWGLTIE